MIRQPELKVKKIRELRNLTQEYMASQLDLSLRAYSKIEAGETQLTIKRINEISKIFNVAPLELLNFDEDIIFNNTIKENEDTDVGDNMVKQLKETLSALMEQNKILIGIIEKLRT